MNYYNPRPTEFWYIALAVFFVIVMAKTAIWGP